MNIKWMGLGVQIMVESEVMDWNFDKYFNRSVDIVNEHLLTFSRKIFSFIQSCLHIDDTIGLDQSALCVRMINGFI